MNGAPEWIEPGPRSLPFLHAVGPFFLASGIESALTTVTTRPDRWLRIAGFETAGLTVGFHSIRFLGGDLSAITGALFEGFLAGGHAFYPLFAILGPATLIEPFVTPGGTGTLQNFRLLGWYLSRRWRHA